MNDSMSAAMAAMEELEASAPKNIPFELFDNKTRKTTKLADLSISIPMKGRHEWYDYKFLEPVFVSSIVVQASNYDYKDCSFKWISLSNGEKVVSDIAFQSTSFQISVNDLISSFSFRPDRKYFSDPKITSVTASGFTLEEFHKEREKIGRIIELRAATIREAQAIIKKADDAGVKIEGLKAEIEDYERKNENLRETQLQLEAELRSWKEKIESAEREVARSSANMASLESKIETQEAIIKQRETERDSITHEIEKRKIQLNQLANDIYLFPSELGEFAKRGGTDKAFYWKLTALPLLVLAAMAATLLLDAHNLASIFDENENARIFSIFLTRLPYVIVATAIIGAMYKVAKVLISEIIRIDTQTRGLAKLSIIATDVSAASADGLDLSDEERHHLRTGLKMDLLREHLKSYIAESYDYSASDRVKKRIEFLERRRTAKAKAESELEHNEVT